jgi:metal-responsive CopG/Arc/MetJ family transcriptional regulator
MNKQEKKTGSNTEISETVKTFKVNLYPSQVARLDSMRKDTGASRSFMIRKAIMIFLVAK